MKNEALQILTLLLSLMGRPEVNIEIDFYDNLDALSPHAMTRTIAAHVIFKGQGPEDPHKILISKRDWVEKPDSVKAAVMFHEIAHVINVADGNDIHENASHGKSFKKVCRELKELVGAGFGIPKRACRGH